MYISSSPDVVDLTSEAKVAQYLLVRTLLPPGALTWPFLQDCTIDVNTSGYTFYKLLVF